ncbi:MAG: hypothetical protein K6E59_06550 [Bacilli bacterium]|nr:hypothetical protein [Bacilli bacterium]
MTEHYAEDYSLFMGIVDLVPVILFALAGCILIKELFNKLKKPFAVMLCSGVTLSLTAGVFKAIWKILLSLNVCDFYPFDVMFMPTQSLGFVLMGIGLLSLLFEKKQASVANVNALPLLLFLPTLAVAARPENGSMVFIALLVIGELMIATSLSYLAIKNKNWLCLVLFIVSCVALIVMGAMKPISEKSGMNVTTANWVEEAINIIAQGTLLVGAYLLGKKGFLAFKEPIES